MNQKKKGESDSEIKIDGEHGYNLAGYLTREPRNGDFVQCDQFFSFLAGDGYEAIPEPVRITNVASRPGSYWGAQHPAGSYDFHDADSDQSDVREIFRMRLWGRIVDGAIVPV